MKKFSKHADLVTGIVVGALVGLHFPQLGGETYHLILVIAGLVLGAKYLGLVK